MTLRPFREGDVGALHRCIDAEAMRLTGSAHSAAEAEAALTEAPPPRMREWYAGRNLQPDRLDLAVEENATGVLVGEVGLDQLDPVNSSCSFRILLGPQARDRGLGTEATVLMVANAFHGLGLHRVELDYFAFNPRAGRAYEKAGFVVEGRRRQVLAYEEHWVDSIVMSALATEWSSPTG